MQSGFRKVAGAENPVKLNVSHPARGRTEFCRPVRIVNDARQLRSRVFVGVVRVMGGSAGATPRPGITACRLARAAWQR
jgi:hypothetical protein